MGSENPANIQPDSLTAFAELCERLAATSSRLERAGWICAYLRSLDPEATEIGARLLVGRLFPEAQGRKLSLSGSAVWRAVESLGAAVGQVNWEKVADFGEAVRQVFREPGEIPVRLSIRELAETGRDIAAASGAGSRQRKIDLLASLFRRATGLEAKYIAKVVIGEMRHGAQEGIVLDAIALLADAPGELVRRAQQNLGDIGRLARIAREGGKVVLGRVALQLFRPLKPMLAQTATGVAAALAELGDAAAFEWKLDGARVQIHKEGDRVHLFSRRLKDITASLPELAAQLAAEVSADSAILEGEVIATSGNRPLAFQELMRRFRRIREIETAASETPVKLYLFDCLYVDGEPLLDLPLSVRWERLQGARGPVPCVGRLITADPAAAEAFYQTALAAGYEGLMVKALDAPYTPGARGKNWLKVKKVTTLDLAIIAADWGYGRRRGWLSNYHLAARDQSTGRFVPVGKTFKGLTDQQFRAMTERLLALETGRRGGTVFVRPEVVVEVHFSDVQKSPQYECGMALRFARIRAIRDDKSAEEADTLQTLAALRGGEEAGRMKD